MDSTSIAALARLWLGDFCAVTFSVDLGAGTSFESDDLTFARRAAQDLGVPLKVVLVRPEDLLTLIDPVLMYGQDWRDFNVHCGIVNLAIARAIRAEHQDGTRPLLLTGDGMNELMADYSPVIHNGLEYYSLPRLPQGRLRRFLVQGLDAGDREVGIFAHQGIDVIQPYLLCADAYTALPDEWMADPGVKARLARACFGDSVPSYIYQRRKVRAQVGSEGSNRGVLGVLADRGIDARWLQARFSNLFSIDQARLPSMIRAGVYRFPTTFEAMETS
jgi:asparagine synthetase B (glutamine-hydrolysing)